MAPQCSSNNTNLEPKKGKIDKWEMEHESSTTFEGSGDDGGNTAFTVLMGSSQASLGDSSWANAELEDLFEEASPKPNMEENKSTNEKVVVCTTSDLMTPPPRQRSTLSISEFEREGLLKHNRSDRSLPKASIQNPLVSPRERKGLKKSKSERFTGLDTPKKVSKQGSFRDLKKEGGTRKPSSRRGSQGFGSDSKDLKKDAKPIKPRKAKDNFESSDWLTSCYVDPFEKEGDNEPKRRTRTIVVDNDDDDEINSHDGNSISSRDGLSISKRGLKSSRPTMHRTTSMQSVQRANKEEPPACAKNANYVWNNDQVTSSSTHTTTTDTSSSTTKHPIKRSTSNTEGGDGKDRRGRFALSKAFHSFRQLPTGAITSPNKQSNLKAVLRGAVKVVERRPSGI